jgi:hypothetical protein
MQPLLTVSIVLLEFGKISGYSWKSYKKSTLNVGAKLSFCPIIQRSFCPIIFMYIDDAVVNRFRSFEEGLYCSNISHFGQLESVRFLDVECMQRSTSK